MLKKIHSGLMFGVYHKSVLHTPHRAFGFGIAGRDANRRLVVSQRRLPLWRTDFVIYCKLCFGFSLDGTKVRIEAFR